MAWFPNIASIVPAWAAETPAAAPAHQARSHPLIDHMVTSHAERHRRSTSRSTAARPRNAAPSTSLAGLPEELLLGTIRATPPSDHVSLARSNATTNRILDDEVAVDLMQRRAVSIGRFRTPTILQRIVDMVLGPAHPLGSGGDVLALSREQRLPAFVTLLGSPPNDERNLGSGIYGIASVAQRDAVLEAMDDTACRFGFPQLAPRRHHPTGHLVWSYRTDPTPPDLRAHLKMLMLEMQTASDVLCLIGTPPNAEGRGASGLLGLSRVEQFVLFPSIIFQMENVESAEWPAVLPALAEIARRLGHGDPEQMLEAAHAEQTMMIRTLDRSLDRSLADVWRP